MDLTPKLLGVLLYICWIVTYIMAGYFSNKMILFISWMFFLFACAAMIRVRPNPESLKSKRIFITDATSKIGFALLKYLLELDAVVFAGTKDTSSSLLLELKKQYSSNLHILKCDVNLTRDIGNCVIYLCNNLGNQHLHAVVNTATVQHIGETELQLTEKYEEMFKINYFGAVNVAKGFLPLLRENTRKARLINVCSLHGRVSMPFHAGFSDSQAAVESFTDGLRREMSRFELKIILLELGQFSSVTSPCNIDELWRRMLGNQKETYGREYIESIQREVTAETTNASNNLGLVLDAFSDALGSDNPKDRYSVGCAGIDGILDSLKVCALLGGFLPASLMDWIIEVLSIRKMPLPSELQQRSTETKWSH